MKRERQPYDNCNICGKYSKLTKDHIPPKFWNNSGAKSYTYCFGVGNPKQSKQFFSYKARGGITYRSLCSNCNNTIVGGETDNSLKEFVDR